MAVLARFLRTLDNAAWAFARFLGRTTESYIDIETWQDETTLVCRDGALLSIIDIHGYRALTGGETDEFDQLVETLRLALAPQFASEGYRFQLVHHRDPSASAVEQLLTEHIDPILQSTHRTGLDLDDVLEANKRVLRPLIAAEFTTLAVWTMPTAIAWNERKINLSAMRERMRKGPRIAHGQHFDAALHGLITQHQTMRDAIIRAMPAYNLAVLTTTEALRRMRNVIDLDVTSASWAPELLPHRAFVPAAGVAPTDASYLAPSPIAEQIAPTPIMDLDHQLMRIGRRTYAMSYLVLAPDQLRSFDTLVGLIGNMPWRVAWMMTPGAQTQLPVMLRKTVAAFAIGQNHIRNAYKEISTDPSAQLLGLQASFCTWVEGEDTPETRDQTRVQAARLVRALQTWGNAQGDNHVGNKFHAFFETVPGASRHTRSPAAIAPLDDALYLQPIARPGSPWRHGSVVMRTADGQIYPVDQFSPKQAAWVNLIFASMGGGKSVLANALNRALATSPTAETLPYITILDVGPASSGVVSLLREALPADQQHLAVHRRLRLVAEDAINPFDTGYVGLRRPLPSRKAWLLSLLRLFCLPVNAERPHERVDSMLEALVELTYTQFLVKDARRFSRNILPEVDKAIDDYGIHEYIKPNTTWWELVDVLWMLHINGGERDALYLAELAQTMAVPTLADLVRICTSEVLRTTYSGTVASTGEPVYAYVQASLNTAIAQYPNLATATKVFLNARIVALDLEPVMPAGTADAARQGTIMAMVARELGASRYFVHPTDFDTVKEEVLPEIYVAHHRADAQRMLEMPKRIQYDEFHRFAHPVIEGQVITDARMTRRNKIDITLISQSILDFSPVLVTVASSIWIASGVNPEAKVLPHGAKEPVRLATLIQSTFSMTESAITTLRRLPKPGATGAHYIASFKTDSGATYVHHLVLTLPPEEIWAYSTTAEDRSLRDRLYTAVGPKAARALLCARFPAGTAVPLIEQRRAALGDQARDQASATVVEQIAAELLQQQST
jgi:intracellular multiplication protein IcmB